MDIAENKSVTSRRRRSVCFAIMEEPKHCANAEAIVEHRVRNIDSDERPASVMLAKSMTHLRSPC